MAEQQQYKLTLDLVLPPEPGKGSYSHDVTVVQVIGDALDVRGWLGNIEAYLSSRNVREVAASFTAVKIAQEGGQDG